MNLIAGENGILKRATNTADKSNLASIEEEIRLHYNAVMIDVLANHWDNAKKAEELEKELRKEDSNATVIPVETDLLVNYKGKDVTITNEGEIILEDESMGAKPTGRVDKITTAEGVAKVELQVIASTTDGTIQEIQPLNGAVLKEGTTDRFEVTSNGIYYFRIKGSNGRTAIVKSEEVSNVLEISNSLLEGISKISSSGLKKVKVAGKTETKTYSLDVIHNKGDLVLDGIQDVEGVWRGKEEGKNIYVFGTQADVATDSEYAQNTVVLKVEGNLTINNGVKVRAVQSEEGYGGPKGMIIYCTGTLTNNGMISMTACGARAEGENVYLWKNTEGNFEYVPAVGGAGGIIPSTTNTEGNNGENGTSRATGGGGSGANGNANPFMGRGCGAKGTSYSGGTGGGGHAIEMTGHSIADGEENGGAGGEGSRIEGDAYSGGGAGNPGAIGHAGNGTRPDLNGENGTGGLLVIYANAIQNNADIEANGKRGGGGDNVFSGGSSGGGSINIFYKTNYANKGQITANGGIENVAYKGGDGGTGSISVGSIGSGKYESTFANY